MRYFGSYDKNGELNIEKLKIELQEIQGNVTDNKGDFPVTVIVDGYTFEIDNEGNVDLKGENQGGEEIPEVPSFNPEDLEIGENAQNADKYGYKVTNYNVKEDETGGWRLFYQDNNYTYLITDNCIGSYKPSDYYETYQTGADVSIVGQKLNAIINSLFTSTNIYTNIRTTAWLTDTSDTGMWKDYKNSDAVFAIGSPTVELFVASYNATGKSNTITLTLGDCGYKENTASGWFSVEDNHGIYNKATTTNWWLASPRGYDGGCELLCER